MIFGSIYLRIAYFADVFSKLHKDFLYITCLLFLSTVIAAASAPSTRTMIVTFTSIYALL